MQIVNKPPKPFPDVCNGFEVDVRALYGIICPGNVVTLKVLGGKLKCSKEFVGRYHIWDAYIGVTTQGRTPEEAMKNLREALELYFEEFPEKKPEKKEE